MIIENRFFGLLALLIAAIFPFPTYGCEFACEASEHEEILASTKAVVMEAGELEIANPYDVLGPQGGVACTLLIFDISEEGKATNIQVISSHPERLLDRAAFQALRSYVFKLPGESGLEHGAMLFELRLN